MPKILRRAAVEEKSGLKKTAIYKKMAADGFPRPVDLGGGIVGWLEHEVDAWIDQRITERDEQLRAEQPHDTNREADAPPRRRGRPRKNRDAAAQAAPVTAAGSADDEAHA